MIVFDYQSIQFTLPLAGTMTATIGHNYAMVTITRPDGSETTYSYRQDYGQPTIGFTVQYPSRYDYDEPYVEPAIAYLRETAAEIRRRWRPYRRPIRYDLFIPRRVQRRRARCRDPP